MVSNIETKKIELKDILEVTCNDDIELPNLLQIMKFTKNNQAVKCTLTSKTAWEEKSGSTVFYK